MPAAAAVLQHCVPDRTQRVAALQGPSGGGAPQGIGMFRCVAALCRNETVGNTGSSFFFLVLMLLGGFLLSRDDIPPWWIWVYW